MLCKTITKHIMRKFSIQTLSFHVKTNILLRIIVLSLFLGVLSGQKKLVFEDHFSDNAANWIEEKGNGYQVKIKKGHYVLRQDGKSGLKSYISFKKLNLEEYNFEILARLRQTEGSDDIGFGLIWGLYNDNYYRYFIIASQGYFRVVKVNNKKHTALTDWIKIPYVKPIGEYNTLRVSRTANVVTFYVNGQEVYKSGAWGYFGDYSKIGFYLGGKMTIEADLLKVWTSPLQINTIELPGFVANKKKLPETVNTKEEELSPVISPDGKTLYFIRKTEEGYGGQDIYYSVKKTDGTWSEAKNIGPPLNNASHNFVISVSPDNNMLVVNGQYTKEGNYAKSGISVTRRQADGSWGIPEPIRIEDYQNINKYVGFFMANNNKILLMSVERKDEGYGDLDLYVSFKKEDGTWSKPRNLGSTINTFGAEGNPFLASDGKTLFFLSNGHLGYGYDDIFVAKRLDDTWMNWSKPQNLGKQINTEDYDLSYFISAKGDVAYISSTGDLYVANNPFKPEAVVLVKGKVFNKKTGKPMSADISYQDLSTGKELGTAISDPGTGEYQITLPAGKKYGFFASKKNFFSVSDNLDLTTLKEYTEIEKDLYLSPIDKGETIRLNNIFFEVNKAEIKEESYPELDRLVKIMKENPQMKIEIAGHTDDTGSDEYNLRLSQKRADAVAEYLKEKSIASDRVLAKGYGETRPVKPNTSEENRAYNRRVEFKILEK